MHWSIETNLDLFKNNTKKVFDFKGEKMQCYALITLGQVTSCIALQAVYGCSPDCWRTGIVTNDLETNTTILTECDVHYRFRLVVFYYGGDRAVHVGGPGLL